MIVATESGAFNETSGQFPAMTGVAKTRYFRKKVRTSPAVIMETKPGVFIENQGK